MGLRGCATASAVIKTPGDEFVVRSLDFDAIESLVRTNFAAATALWETFADQETVDFGAVINEALRMAPGLVAQIIAFAVDDPEVEDMDERLQLVRKLPFTAQMEALEAIAELTFATEGGPKKVVEIVIRAANRLTETIQSFQDSPDGSGDSAAR